MYAWDLPLRRGLSAYDIRNSFSSNFTYQLPWGQGLTGLTGVLVRGWQVNGILTLMDGSPLTVLDSSTAQNERIGQSEGLTVDLKPGGNPNPVLGGSDRYYDVSQFEPSKLGFFGTLPRNTVIGPGLAVLRCLAVQDLHADSGSGGVSPPGGFQRFRSCKPRNSGHDGVHRRRGESAGRRDRRHARIGAPDAVRHSVHVLDDVSTAGRAISRPPAVHVIDSNARYLHVACPFPVRTGWHWPSSRVRWCSQVSCRRVWLSGNDKTSPRTGTLVAYEPLSSESV